ncbi:lipopolysaccharide assembly protein LapB [Aliikangiella sp. G2MR2-5]|uniref:lipopolysaccharide assembly protein LapB n=1 Tax=Aliikangiella sp. G2MR2-5 TaxID=2788943 RepID=UPI0018AA7192|nr:lipopolysaccharide assembly protein LapB [Aliikangiella sp. G2MR2-5]
MSNEILIIFALLFPIAWYFGYRNGKQSGKSEVNDKSAGLSRQYFTGLNYLLNEQSDKAIDTFVSLLEVDSETVETHLALGNLFRKRGEVDRAIRIHQNLIARPSLSAKHRKMSLLELGDDYMAAGLLDRAEHIFKELVLDPQHKQASLSQLLQIYQQTKDWQNAIKVAEKLHLGDAPERRKEIAHFYCELAEEFIFEQSMREAVNQVKKALSIDPSCARATLISGTIHYNNGRYKKAIKSYRDLMHQNINLLPEAIDNIRAAFIQLSDQRGFIKFLEQSIEAGAGISVILSYAQELQVEQGDKVAADFIARQMVKHPSIKGLLKLINLHLKHASETAKPSLQMLHDVVTKLLKNKPVYHCNHCGFDTKTLFWQCPGCKSWGSVEPIQGIEGE